MNASRNFRLAAIALAAACIAAAPAFARDTYAEGQFDRSLKVTGAVDLAVNTGSGSISVRTGDASTVHVIGRIRASSGWHISESDAQAKVKAIEANPPIEQNGNIIRIGDFRDEELRRNVSVSYEIVVPADTRLRSDTGSGSQELDGIKGPVESTAGSGSLRISHIGGEVRATTGSGHVTLDEIQGSVRAGAGSGSIHADSVNGGLVAHTGSGNIESSLTGAGDVEAQTGSGSIDLRGVKGRVDAHTGSGSVRVDGTPTGDWRVHSSSGGVTLRLPADLGFELDASTGSGGITTSHELSFTGTFNRHSLRGKSHGGGPMIVVSTSSGTIRVE